MPALRAGARQRARQLQARPAGLRPRSQRDAQAAARPTEVPRTYSPDPTWCRILEYYCPQCGTMMEVEYLPPGHPPPARHRFRPRCAETAMAGSREMLEPHPTWRWKRPAAARAARASPARRPEVRMKRVSVDIGGTFTDCFVSLERALRGRQGAHHAPQPRPRLQRGREPRRGRSRGSRPRTCSLGRFRALCHDARHQRADRAQGPAHRPDRHRGFQERSAALARVAMARVCPKSTDGSARATRPPIVPNSRDREFASASITSATYSAPTKPRTCDHRSANSSTRAPRHSWCCSRTASSTRRTNCGCGRSSSRSIRRACSARSR